MSTTISTDGRGERAARVPERLRFEPLSIEQVAERLSGIAVPWYIAGGWALDLFLGRQTRAHEDVEIAIFRGDEGAVRARLREWEIFIAGKAALARLAEDALPADAHELYARERGHDAFQLEILVEERAGTRWLYRRDHRIGLHARDLGRVTAEGVPYVRPDVQLLYKSKGTRPVDQSDFLTVLPRLDPAERAFLAAALWTTSPGHPWLERLR